MYSLVLATQLHRDFVFSLVLSLLVRLCLLTLGALITHTDATRVARHRGGHRAREKRGQGVEGGSTWSEVGLKSHPAYEVDSVVERFEPTSYRTPHPPPLIAPCPLQRRPTVCTADVGRCVLMGGGAS